MRPRPCAPTQVALNYRGSDHEEEPGSGAERSYLRYPPRFPHYPPHYLGDTGWKLAQSLDPAWT
jgi:hypothetical protein